MKAVITVIGKDRVGIIARVSGMLADAEVNVLDISQTIMQDMFTMVMLVDIGASKVAFNVLAEDLDKLGQQLGLSISIQREEVFQSMHRI